MENLSQFINFLQSILIPKVDLTGLDLILLCVFVFYAFEGYAVGFISSLFDLASFVLSFVVGLKGYGIFSHLLSSAFSIPSGISNAVGFFLASTIAEIVFGTIGRVLSKNINDANPLLAKTNKVLGIIPALASAFVLLSFLLTLVVSLPVSPFLKHTISSSKIGSLLVSNTSKLETSLNFIFGQAAKESLNFFTVEPQSNEMVQLHFSVSNPSIDVEAETEMVKLVNSERSKLGLSTLTADSNLTLLAREHARDMFVNGYFSHYTKDGLTPFDRMAKANIPFDAAGENLALAPNTLLAMQGLMNSQAHKENILSSQFHKIGVGVLDGGIYGEMFVQEFTN